MRIMSILFILACAASLSALAQEADGNTATTIRALEHEWVDGQSRNNNRALDLIFDNALVYVEYGQLVTKGGLPGKNKAGSSSDRDGSHDRAPIWKHRHSHRCLPGKAGKERAARVKALAIRRHLGAQVERSGVGRRSCRPDLTVARSACHCRTEHGLRHPARSGPPVIAIRNLEEQ
jgi:hypothetical protein